MTHIFSWLLTSGGGGGERGMIARAEGEGEDKQQLEMSGTGRGQGRSGKRPREGIAVLPKVWGRQMGRANGICHTRES